MDQSTFEIILFYLGIKDEQFFHQQQLTIAPGLETQQLSNADEPTTETIATTEPTSTTTTSAQASTSKQQHKHKHLNNQQQ